MALLTPEERRKLPQGLNVKHKCDDESCAKPILSSLIYATADGREGCTKACRDRMERNSSTAETKIQSKEKDKMKFAKKKKDEEEVKKSKKARDEEDEEDEEVEDEDETSEDEDEEEAEEDEDEDEKPAKGKKKAVAKKAAKKSKKTDDEDEEEAEEEEEEDEDEKPAKGKKKIAAKDKKKSKKSDDDDEDEDEKPKKKKGAKTTSSVGSKTNPYREGSKVAVAFELARKGISKKDLQKHCKKEGFEYNWLLGRFRKHAEGLRGVSWKVKETEDDVKLILTK